MITEEIKLDARAQLSRAIRFGELVRPRWCSACHRECKPDGHHDDYLQALAIRWLCHSCHFKWHRGIDKRVRRFGMIHKAAFYTRLSPNPTKDDTINQERDLREYVEKQGWEVVEHYKDIHLTGSKGINDRPELKRMMEDASKKRFDILLFWSLDRLSREGCYETLQYLNQLNGYGVEYKSFTEQYLDSCGIFKDAVISIMAAIAKQERIRLIERTKAGLKTAREKGVKLGRPSVELDVDKLKDMLEHNYSVTAIANIFKKSESSIRKVMNREGLTK